MISITSRTSSRGDTPEAVVHLLDNPATLFVARFCLALPFLVGGLQKLMDWQGAQAEMARAGLSPAWLFNIAVVATELVGSALVIFDRKTWFGAGALGVFTVLSTFLAHRFREFSGDAWGAELNAFLEHASIGAAFILVVVVGLRASGARHRSPTDRQ